MRGENAQFSRDSHNSRFLPCFVLFTPRPPQVSVLELRWWASHACVHLRMHIAGNLAAKKSALLNASSVYASSV